MQLRGGLNRSVLDLRSWEPISVTAGLQSTGCKRA